MKGFFNKYYYYVLVVVTMIFTYDYFFIDNSFTFKTVHPILALFCLLFGIVMVAIVTYLSTLALFSDTQEMEIDTNKLFDKPRQVQTNN